MHEQPLLVALASPVDRIPTPDAIRRRDPQIVSLFVSSGKRASHGYAAGPVRDGEHSSPPPRAMGSLAMRVSQAPRSPNQGGGMLRGDDEERTDPGKRGRSTNPRP